MIDYEQVKENLPEETKRMLEGLAKSVDLSYDALMEKVMGVLNSGKVGPDGTFQQHDGGSNTIVRASPKKGRNSKCSCMSGKKFKNCCGKEI